MYFIMGFCGGSTPPLGLYPSGGYAPNDRAAPGAASQSDGPKKRRKEGHTTIGVKFTTLHYTW